MSARDAIPYATHPLFSRAVKVLASVEHPGQWSTAMNFVGLCAQEYAALLSGVRTGLPFPGFVSDVMRHALGRPS